MPCWRRGKYEAQGDCGGFAGGIGSNFPFNHLWPLVAGGGGMSDFWKDYEPEPTKAAPMTTDRALDLALEWQNKDWNSESPMSADLAISEANDVINALMQALEAPVQEPTDIWFEKCFRSDTPAAQPAPVQEPVATLWQHGETGRTRITMPGDITDCDARWFKAADLYTTPPAAQRQWVGLTDEEHTQIALESGCMSADWVFYGAAVERKVKEKNF